MKNILAKTNPTVCLRDALSRKAKVKSLDSGRQGYWEVGRVYEFKVNIFKAIAILFEIIVILNRNCTN